MIDAVFNLGDRRRCLILSSVSGLLLLIASACVPAQPEGERPESPFFDLRAYFNQEIERLQEEQPSVEKTVWFDGESQTEKLDSLDYSRELEVFLNADINRAAWWDKYQIDSIRNDGQLRELRYTATDPSLRVNQLSIFFEEGEVSRVEASTGTEGFTADREQQLVFDPREGYRIETMQDVTFSKPRQMKIEVVF